MEIDLSNPVVIAIGCVCLCGVGFVLMTGLQFIGGFLDIFTSIFGMIFDILSGGPVSWCGCLVFLFICIGGIVLAVVVSQGLATCGTPQAINLCSLFGQ